MFEGSTSAKDDLYMQNPTHSPTAQPQAPTAFFRFGQSITEVAFLESYQGASTAEVTLILRYFDSPKLSRTIRPPNPHENVVVV